MSYERGAVKKMDAFGLRSQCYTFPADITDEAFKKEFTAINEDPDVSGILLLRPLPKQICEKDIEAMIDPKKDLDGISPVNTAKVFSGDSTGFAPCTAEAVIEVLKAYDISMEGKRASDRRPQHGCRPSSVHAPFKRKCHKSPSATPAPKTFQAPANRLRSW